MVNPYRGEVLLILNGVSHVLKLTLGALAELEEALGTESLLDLVERFGDQDRPNLIPTLWLPLLAGITLGLFQLTPLTPGLADWLASGTVRWRSELVNDEPELGSVQPTRPTC